MATDGDQMAAATSAPGTDLKAEEQSEEAKEDSTVAPAANKAEDTTVPPPAPDAAANGQADATVAAAQPATADGSKVADTSSDNASAAASATGANANGTQAKKTCAIDEDAPPTSRAYDSVRFSEKEKRYIFSFRNGASRQTFQTTLKRVSGCHETASRICRLCFVKLEEESWTKEDTTMFREEMYSRFDLFLAAGGAPKTSPSAARAIGTSATPEPATVARPAKASPPPKPSPKQGANGTSAPAAVGSSAAVATAARASPAGTTTAGAKNSSSSAGGGTKTSMDPPLKKRDSMDEKQQKQPKRRKTEEAVDDVTSLTSVEQTLAAIGSRTEGSSGGSGTVAAAIDCIQNLLDNLRQNGQHEKFLCFGGRSASRTNSYLNGLYVLRKTLIHGQPSYEKVDSSTGGAVANPKYRRILCFSAPQKCWKVVDKLNDRKTGFCHMGVTDASNASVTLPSELQGVDDHRWEVYEGSAQEYQVDNRMRCFDPLSPVADVIVEDPGFTPSRAASADEKIECQPPTPLANTHSGKKKETKKKKKVEEVKLKKEQVHYSALIASGNVDAEIEMVRKTGQIEDTVLVEGRKESAKNSSINGLYVLRSTPFHGSKSYEKLSDSQTRYLFYSATKGAWKISNNFNDKQTGFAFAKWKWVRPEDRMTLKPCQLKLKWRVFDGKDDGYNRDKNVACEDLQLSIDGTVGVDPPKSKAKKKGDSGSSAASEDTRDSDSELKSEEEDKSDENSDKEKSDENSDKDKSDENSDKDESKSEKGSSSGSASSSEGEDDKPAGKRAKAAPKAPAKPKSGATPVRKPQQKGRVCAKMLVRSGLRCPCHFSYIQDCTNKLTK